MMIEKLEADLKLYTEQIETLNKELVTIEDKRKEILRVGTRLEGVIAYIRKAIEEEKAKQVGVTPAEK
jgi:prefoldin subunit 5